MSDPYGHYKDPPRGARSYADRFAAKPEIYKIYKASCIACRASYNFQDKIHCAYNLQPTFPVATSSASAGGMPKEMEATEICSFFEHDETHNRLEEDTIPPRELTLRDKTELYERAARAAVNGTLSPEFELLSEYELP